MALLRKHSKPLPWKTVTNFRLLDQFGDSHELRDYSDKRAIVIFVHGRGCPIVRQQLQLLAELKNSFESQDISFLFLNANSQDRRKELVQDALDYNINFSILDDTSQIVARSLKLTRTAEVIVIDPRDWRIAYRGPIDDRVDYEGAKPSSSRRYLEWALEAISDENRFSYKVDELKGCLINFEFEQESRDYETSIVPILESSCLRCHSEGGIAPWQMDSIENLRGWSPMIQEVLLSKRMPPWYLDPDIGSFANDYSLSDSEIYKLYRWLESGLPNDKNKPDPLKELEGGTPAEWSLGTPDMVVTMANAKVVPASGQLEYVRELGDAQITEDTWLEASILIPGDATVVHHARAIIFPDGPEGEKFVKSVEHIVPIPGPSNMQLKGESFYVDPTYYKNIAGYVAGYDSGSFFPKDTGLFLPKGSKFLFEIHYVTTGKETEDRTKVGLYFAKSKPKRKMVAYSGNRFDINIPANTDHSPFATLYQVDHPMWISTLSPHMHYRGKQMLIEAIFPDGSIKPLISVPSYSFNWQNYYILKEELALPVGTLILATGAFDNSLKNPLNPNPAAHVRFGLRSTDEMFSAVVIGARDHVDTERSTSISDPLQLIESHQHLREYFASKPELVELLERFKS